MQQHVLRCQMSAGQAQGFGAGFTWYRTPLRRSDGTKRRSIIASACSVSLATHACEAQLFRCYQTGRVVLLCSDFMHECGA